jgi:two-component system nitrogen regulation response regulator NtrX
MGKAAPGLNRELIAALKAHRFPGNIRELRNVLEHLLIIHREGELGTVGIERLLQSGKQIGGFQTLGEAVTRFEEEYIGRALRECGGNMSKAAEMLGLDRSYLYRKMKALGMEGAE